MLKWNRRSNFKLQEIKGQIYDREGIPVGEQRLMFKGRQLDDARTLADYGVAADSSLHLALRLRGGMMHESSGREGYSLPLAAQAAADEPLSARLPGASHKMHCTTKGTIGAVGEASINASTGARGADDDNHTAAREEAGRKRSRLV